ncbi:MAG: inorganic phosphate transporter [Micropepsaceae bacterium]
MLTSGLLLLVAILAVSYANGANDTFKGVATLYGSGISSYKVALCWAVVTTLAGSLVAAVFAQDLVSAFSGKGLVPTAVLADKGFMIAAAFGAAFTVFAAALLGIPISTTHSLIGALAGAGLMASESSLNFSALGGGFLLPLALSPFLSVMLVMGLHPVFAWLSRRSGIGQSGCVCLADDAIVSSSGGALVSGRSVSIVTGDASECTEEALQPVRALVRAEVTPALRAIHFLSAGAVSFARGTNDAPKIVGVALAAQAVDLQTSTVLIALAMAAGGLMHSRRIAQTLATRILPIHEAEGALANTVTSGLVVSASLAGLPVSTTHVSVGSLFGLAATKGGADWRVISMIVSSWLLTLPMALAASAVIYLAIH